MSSGESNLRHLILDWNGTLIDDLDAAVASVNSVLEGQGIRPIDRESYRRSFGFPIKDFYGRLGVNFEKVSFADLGRQYLARFNEAIKTCSVFPGTFELLDAASERGYTVSILSASERGTLHANLRAAGLLERVHHVYGLGDGNATGKFELAQELDDELGAPGDAAVLIGDTEHDVAVARSLGWRSLSVCHGHQSRERLLETQAEVWRDIPELLRSDLLGRHNGSTA